MLLFSLAYGPLAHQGEWNEIKMAEEGMGCRFPSLTSPPLGTPAHRQPLTLSLPCLGLSFSLSAFFPLSVASSSQHRIVPGFPSSGLTGFLVSPMHVPQTAARNHPQRFLPLSHRFSPEPSISHAPSVPPSLCMVDTAEEPNQDQGLFHKAWS